MHLQEQAEVTLLAKQYPGERRLITSTQETSPLVYPCTADFARLRVMQELGIMTLSWELVVHERHWSEKRRDRWGPRARLRNGARKRKHCSSWVEAAGQEVWRGLDQKSTMHLGHEVYSVSLASSHASLLKILRCHVEPGAWGWKWKV